MIVSSGVAGAAVARAGSPSAAISTVAIVFMAAAFGSLRLNPALTRSTPDAAADRDHHRAENGEDSAAGRPFRGIDHEALRRPADHANALADPEQAHQQAKHAEHDHEQPYDRHFLLPASGLKPAALTREFLCAPPAARQTRCAP